MAAYMAEAERFAQPQGPMEGRGRNLARRAGALLAALALAACSTVVPRTAAPTVGPAPAAPPPVAQPVGPSAGLPEDQARNRVAVLVPLTGTNAPVGRSIADAANLAILDTGAARIRITVYDTAAPGGAAAAAARAIADGNKLFLGPLLGPDVAAVAPAARAANVPVVSFSNDVGVAGPGVFLMGFTPSQSIERVVAYARSRGLSRFAGLIPAGTYGRRAGNALLQAANQAGGQVVAMQSFERTPAALAAAVKKLGPAGSYDAVLIAEGGRISLQAAPLVRRAAGPAPRLLGTELWNADATVATAPPLAGAWFASVPDAMYRQLAARYRARFGRGPYRLASLGYDGVLLAVRIGNDWAPGASFPARALRDPTGFSGVDGAFRFDRDGVAERAMEVKQAGPGGAQVIAPAPTGFAK